MAKLVGPTYAKALFELGVETNELEATFYDFKEFNQICKENPKFLELLINPKISLIEKKEMIDDIFKEDSNKNLINFLKILIERRRMFYISDIFNEYEQMYNEHFNIKHVIVTSAVELKADEVERLKQNLHKSTGSEIILQTKVNSSLIGGIQIQIGEKLIDASTKKRIEDIYFDLSKISLKV